ncbi:MAG: hypothetical protein JAZ15_03035 [Candidatus Thiodiazotropha endolucinida]|nr:hypothetical protein [Candidatus Thiodiazotropha taylori]MCW4311969.1 hypothetical protein [Candidatus Thiodiazotropha taylori]
MISSIEIRCGLQIAQAAVEHKEVTNRINDCMIWLASLPPLQSIVICGYGFTNLGQQSNKYLSEEKFEIILSYSIPEPRYFFDEIRYYIDNDLLTNNRQGYRLSQFICDDLNNKRELIFTKYSLNFVSIDDSDTHFIINNQVSETYIDDEGNCTTKRLQAWDPYLV